MHKFLDNKHILWDVFEHFTLFGLIWTFQHYIMKCGTLAKLCACFWSQLLSLTGVGDAHEGCGDARPAVRDVEHHGGGRQRQGRGVDRVQDQPPAEGSGALEVDADKEGEEEDILEEEHWDVEEGLGEEKVTHGDEEGEKEDQEGGH